MTWSSYEVEEQIVNVFEAISTETEGLAVLAQNAAYKRHNYEMASATEWLMLVDTKAPEKIKAAMVMNKVGPLKLDAEISEALVDSKRAALRSLYAQADLCRSLMATARKVQDAEL